jgi:PIN domain nuclease of toxin-antitoxin system
MIVLDTSALIRWIDGSPELSSAATQAIQTADRRLVSSISIWEIAQKAKQGRLLMRLSPDELAVRLQRTAGVEIMPVDAQGWIDSVELLWDHKDPADRVIVALAHRFDCPIISSDRVIADFYGKTVW